ncbi:HdeD family acid-resistance protein [Bosea caraganae]|uniref:HdeD family acid-resistance protein n=1 Tax=Bosea caraganae TaxID=2763117 RepID=A0A370L7J3_9HYPH|nr:HdeD family acid-resistance protein [Bosea caraganae]RDJ24894.1 HdeD family acid-resistance protein [Bosea caraganae]RDJ26006.1 HdeD family acid-resistance protein [Bosea caraganae]
MSEAPLHHPPSLGTHLIPLRRNWGWLLAAGIALIILGILGLGAVALLSVASAIWFGAMIFVGGIIMLVDAARHGGWKSRLMHVLIGLLYLALGIFTFLNPLAATLSLTLVAGIMLVAVGCLRTFVAFQTRPMKAWIWILISGLLSLALGVLILAQWPSSGLWVLGTFLAFELIVQGWASIALARAIRSTFDGVISKHAH